MKSKCYSIKYFECDTVKYTSRSAGVTASCQKLFSHDNYLNVLMNSESISVCQKRFGSENQVIYTYSETRKALTPLDNKRYLCNKIVTLPYGHHLLKF